MFPFDYGFSNLSVPPDFILCPEGWQKPIGSVKHCDGRERGGASPVLGTETNPSIQEVAGGKNPNMVKAKVLSRETQWAYSDVNNAAFEVSQQEEKEQACRFRKTTIQASPPRPQSLSLIL